MSRNRNRARKKSVDFKKPTEERTAMEAVAVLPGDIYQSVVAHLGFDPIREAEERRRPV